MLSDTVPGRGKKKKKAKETDPNQEPLTEQKSEQPATRRLVFHK